HPPRPVHDRVPARPAGLGRRPLARHERPAAGRGAGAGPGRPRPGERAARRPVAAGLPQAARRAVPGGAQPRSQAGPARPGMNAPFATALAGWKASAKNKLDWPLVPNVADVDSAESMRIAAGVLDALGVAPNVPSDMPKDPGAPLERAVGAHLRGASPATAPAMTG